MNTGLKALGVFAAIIAMGSAASASAAERQDRFEFTYERADLQSAEARADMMARLDSQIRQYCRAEVSHSRKARRTCEANVKAAMEEALDARLAAVGRI